MSKVTYNQNGYVGTSMSVRAMEAYEAGEMPKSKWTKAAMLNAIESWCEENNRKAFESVKSMKAAELFETFFRFSSWHHTSKNANITNFYALDDEAAMDFSEEMTDEEIAAFEAAKQEQRNEDQAQRDAYEAKQQAKREAELEYQRLNNGVKPNTVKAYIMAHPGCAKFYLSKKGNEIVTVTFEDGSVNTYEAGRIEYIRVYNWSAIEE